MYGKFSCQISNMNLTLAKYRYFGSSAFCLLLSIMCCVLLFLWLCIYFQVWIYQCNNFHPPAWTYMSIQHPYVCSSQHAVKSKHVQSTCDVQTWSMQSRTNTHRYAVMYKSTYPRLRTQTHKYEHPVVCDHVQAAASMHVWYAIHPHRLIIIILLLSLLLLYYYILSAASMQSCSKAGTHGYAHVVCHPPPPAHYVLRAALLSSSGPWVHPMFSSSTNSFSRRGKCFHLQVTLFLGEEKAGSDHHLCWLCEKVSRWSEWFIVFNTHKCIFQCE